MGKIHDFIYKHIERGACTCGKCVDAIEEPKKHQPDGHTFDLTFFKVAAVEDPDKDEFEKIAREVFPKWFDGNAHNYIMMGVDLGDQGLALMCIGLGHLLGVWKGTSPNTSLPGMPESVRQVMAGAGAVSMKVAV